MNTAANKAVIFYHADCVDGFAAAHVIERHIIENTSLIQRLIAVKYNQIETPEEFNKRYGYLFKDGDAEAFVLDFSFPPDVMDHITKRALKVYWLDHHKSAFESLEFDIDTRYDAWASDNFYLTLDNSKSGAMLAWEFVYGRNAEAPDFIKVVDDYDRWVFQYPQTKDAQMYIRSHDMNRDAFDSLMLMSMDEMAQAGGMMRMYYNAQLKAHKNREWMDIYLYGEHGYALNADAAFSSELGHFLAEQSGTFGAVYQVEGALLKFSLRSCGNYDVSALAKKFDGGGHKNAAGFMYDAEDFFKMERAIP